MNKPLLIALLALAGFTTLPAFAAESAASAPAGLAAPTPEAAKTATPENLSAPGKPCHKPGMGMGGMQGMGAMKGMMGGNNRACPKSSCDCPMHTDMNARMMQLEKRIDALQMTLEVLARQQAR